MTRPMDKSRRDDRALPRLAAALARDAQVAECRHVWAEAHSGQVLAHGPG